VGADGSIELHGPHQPYAAFPPWLKLNVLATVPRRKPAASG
jgi:hypothetical protein